MIASEKRSDLLKKEPVELIIQLTMKRGDAYAPQTVRDVAERVRIIPRIEVSPDIDMTGRGSESTSCLEKPLNEDGQDLITDHTINSGENVRQMVDVFVSHIDEQIIEVSEIPTQIHVLPRIIDVSVVTRDQASVIPSAQGTVDMPQIQFPDRVDGISAAMQGQTSRGTVEVPQVQYSDRIANLLVVTQCRVLNDIRSVAGESIAAASSSPVLSEIPRAQHIDKTVDIPATTQRRVPTIELVQKTVEMPRAQFLDRVPDIPVSQDKIPQQTAEQVRDIPVPQGFEVSDRDGNNFISTLDLRHVMTNLGEKPISEFSPLMTRKTKDTEEELVEALSVFSQNTEEELVEAFNVFSQDGVQQRNLEQITETSASSLVEEITEQRIMERFTETPAISLDEEIMKGFETQIHEKIISNLNEDQSEFSETRQMFGEPLQSTTAAPDLKFCEQSACVCLTPQEQSFEVVEHIPQERRLNRTDGSADSLRRDTGAERVKCTHEGPHDENDGDHGRTDGRTDQNKRSRHMDTLIRDASKQARRQDGAQDGKGGKTESKKVYVREQGKTTETTIEELRRAIVSNEVYFVHNGRVLTASEVNGMKHNTVVHAIRRMQGGGKKKQKKSQDTELSSSETDTLAEKVMNGTDPEMMNRLADMSEEDSENMLKIIEQAISKDAPWLARNGAERILSEIRKATLEKREEKREVRRAGEDIEDAQWDEVFGFGRYYGRTYRDVYRNAQQYCEWAKEVESQNKGLTRFQNFLLRIEEKTRENVRKELEKREKKIQLNEMNRAAAASSEEREMNTTTDDAIARHLAAAEDEATAKREAAARSEARTERKAHEEHEEQERLARERTRAEREAVFRDKAAARQEAAARQAAAKFEEAARQEAAAGNEAAAEREAEKAAKQEATARHETAMNEIARSMREHAPKHETVEEESYNEWRKREREWARIWNRQRWDRMKWNQWRNQLTTGDIRYEGIQRKEQENEKSPPGLDNPSDDRQRKDEGEGHTDDVNDYVNDERWRLEEKVREIDARLRRVEERIYDESASGYVLSQGGQETDEDNEQWQKWRGKWWMRVNRAELSSRQRRKISRTVKRMVSRETSDIDHLVNELKQSIAEMRGSVKATQHYHMSSGEDGLMRLHGRDWMGHDDDDDHSW